MSLLVCDHPLAAHYLAELRDRSTQPDQYRRLARELTTLLTLEATRKIRSRQITVETPLEYTEGRRLDQPIAAVPVLRAGLGMLGPVTAMFPDVRVGYIGLERNEETAVARSYYMKLPQLAGCYCLCLDPMLATGGSAAQAIAFMKSHGAEQVTMVSIIAAPEGVEHLQAQHPDVDIHTAALDRGLNDLKYILPGLGDFGDRLYGTF